MRKYKTAYSILILENDFSNYLLRFQSNFKNKMYYFNTDVENIAV